MRTNLLKGLLVVLCCCSLAVQAENLFDPDNYQALTSDKKAYRAGDLLTVIVIESAKAESSAGTGTESGVGFSGGVSDSISNHNVGVNVTGSASGDAKTTRKGALTTTLTVRVIDKLPNGVLKVKGEQTLLINDENQTIYLSGEIREVDIAADNTVLSSRLGNARIEFDGDGIISDAQKAGIISRFFRWLGLI